MKYQKQILIVEDNELEREMLRGVLVKDYEEKYEVLDLSDDLKGRYTWYSGKWPWEGDNKNV